MSKKLTINDILEKEFRTKKIGGLDANDVDAFLNDVIDDYEEYEKNIQDLKKQLEILREENFKIKMNVLNQDSQSIDITQDVEIQKLSNDTKDLEQKDDTLQTRIKSLEDEVAKIKEHTINLNQ